MVDGGRGAEHHNRLRPVRRVDSVSKKAYELFACVGRTLGNTHPLAQIRSVELTYQDLLIWHGTDDSYDPKLSIREERIPAAARNSKEWHVGQGWVEDPAGERILERFQIGAELRTQGSEVRPVIQVVTALPESQKGKGISRHNRHSMGMELP